VAQDEKGMTDELQRMLIVKKALEISQNAGMETLVDILIRSRTVLKSDQFLRTVI